jgi:hypothetical protein
MSRAAFQITTDMLQAAGCKIRFFQGAGEAVSPNGYIVALQFPPYHPGYCDGKWRLANRSKGRWRKVKFRVKAGSCRG